MSLLALEDRAVLYTSIFPIASINSILHGIYTGTYIYIYIFILNI